jgi:lipopolysaccharide export system permease protein
MPILQRYVLRQFLPVFGAGVALFLGVLLMNQFLRLFTLAVMKGLPAWWIMTCFIRLLPSFASLALPMAFLVSSMVTLGQLSDAGEIMALRSAGFSFSEIVKPFFFVAVALSALLLIVNHKTGPEGFHSFRKRTSEAAQKMAKIDLRARAFTPVGPWRLYARETDNRTGRLTGVYLVKPDRFEPVRINAAHGSLTLDPGRGVELILEDGQLQLPNKNPQMFTTGSFERYSVFLPLMESAAPRAPDLQEMTTATLTKLRGEASTPHEKILEYTVETAARSAGALSPFIFFWVAAPLGMGLKRRAKGADFAVSLGVMFAYYGLLVLGVSLGRRHEAWASSAPWIGNAAGLLVGAWLTRRAAKQ